jgi:hypothetical protein
MTINRVLQNDAIAIGGAALVKIRHGIFACHGDHTLSCNCMKE